VSVVDRQQQRARLGQVRGQPEEGVERGERRIDRLLTAHRLVAADHAAREARRPGEQARPLVSGGGRQRRLEELAHDGEREVALELGPARGQRPQAGRSRQRARRLQQAGLPHPGRSLDKHEPPATVGGGLDGRAQLGQLGVALQQLPGEVQGRVQGGPPSRGNRGASTMTPW